PRRLPARASVEEPPLRNGKEGTPCPRPAGPTPDNTSTAPTTTAHLRILAPFADPLQPADPLSPSQSWFSALSLFSMDVAVVQHCRIPSRKGKGQRIRGASFQLAPAAPGGRSTGDTE